MFRHLQFAFVSLVIVFVTASPMLAAEITMRLRGSDLTFTGTVISFDGNTYRLETELFGNVNLDLRRFECVAGACSDTTTESAATVGPDFKIHGSSSIGSVLIPRLIGAYAESISVRASSPADSDPEQNKIELTDNQGIKLASIDMITPGSTAAFQALVDGQAHIGMSSRPITAAEANLLPSVREHVLARDGLLVVVSPENPMSAISIDQLASVFAGKIDDWAQLGQTSGKINVYARNKDSGTLDTFRSTVFGAADRLITPNAQLFGSDAELSDAVAGDPRGIGFTSYAYRRKAKALAISTACGIIHSPSIFGIKAGDYPLSRYFFLYTDLKPSDGHAGGLLDFALSGKAQKIISGAGFINQSLEYLPFKQQGDRIVSALDLQSDNFNLELMQQLISDIGQLSRLSVTLRFRTASFSLDPQSQKKVEQLAAVLSGKTMQGKEILLLGFSDAVGAFDKNRELSVIRAREVKQAILRVSGGRIDEAQLTEKGYGELLPVGCNDNPVGRARNRRVEVWFEAPAAPAQQKKIVAPAPQNNETATPTPPESVATAPQPQNDQTSSGLTEEQKAQLFQEFLEWRRNQQN
jgi:phosphate transport system substrate-binding protein